MDTLKTIVVSGIMALLIAGGTVIVTAPTPTEAPVDNLGALSSPDVASKYLSWGGVRQHADSKTLTTSTTTVCAIKSPAATSTLTFAGIEFVTSSTSASTVTLAKDSDGNGSSTPLQYGSTSANAQAALALIGTTTAAGVANLTFPPSYFLTFTMSGGTGTFSPAGTCKALFTEL